MRLLIIEPDEYYHAEFRKKLGPLGNLWLASEASSVPAAIDEFNPDVIVTEALLGGRTLYELLENLRERLWEKQLIIVVYTKVANLYDIQVAMEYGVNHYLLKGQDTIADLKNLLLTIQNHVQEPRTRNG